MLELTKRRTTPGYTEISLRVPDEDAARVLSQTMEFLKSAGHEVRELNGEGEELFSPSEVFPDSNPARLLRGARLREDMTQADLSRESGIPRRHISEMENNKRPIGKKNARRLAEALKVDYRVLL